MEAFYIGSIVIRADGFELYKRAKHVLSEARRVFLFKMVSEDPTAQNLLQVQPFIYLHFAKDLGNLMNASQESCRDLFNCSCLEIDQVTELARMHGALGSRLTGAGWGGCTVLLHDIEENSFESGIVGRA